MKTVISAGTISPMRLEVRPLYSLQNCIKLMPCCANAGPIGGAGLALPAGYLQLDNRFDLLLPSLTSLICSIRPSVIGHIMQDFTIQR